MSDHESTAEREGIVDQQDAALEQMEEDEGTTSSPHEESTAERAGIVDQQDAVLEAMKGDDDRP
jgi:U3 small nucleolar RNA-associated protein 14